MRNGLLACALVCSLAALAARPSLAAEVEPGGEVFIDPMNVSGGFLSPLTPLSPRPQTQIHIVPAEFHVLQVDIPGFYDERFLIYQIRVGGSVAFARRFEVGAELLPLHVLAARYWVDLGATEREYSDTDVNFGNFSAHFLGNMLALHGQYPMYLSGAFRVTFPTASDVSLDMDDDGSRDWRAVVDTWILEPQILYGVTVASIVTLSTRQGLAIFLSPEERQSSVSANNPPFLGDNQVHWAMNFSAGVAPVRWVSIVADFTAMFCMNPVRSWDPEERDGLATDFMHPRAHPIFAYLGLGLKVYPVPPLSIEAGFRFGLTDEAQYTVGLFSTALMVSYEFDVSLGGVTVIKESKKSTGGGDAS